MTMGANFVSCFVLLLDSPIDAYLMFLFFVLYLYVCICIEERFAVLGLLGEFCSGGPVISPLIFCSLVQFLGGEAGAHVFFTKKHTVHRHM